MPCERLAFRFVSHKVNVRKWAPVTSGFADVRPLMMCQDNLPRVGSGTNSVAGRGNGRICCFALWGSCDELTGLPVTRFGWLKYSLSSEFERNRKPKL